MIIETAVAMMVAVMAQEGSAMNHAVGTFDVTITPAEAPAGAAADAPGRMRLSKTFHGGIEGTGQGEMLATLSPAGSGAYVALEQVSGSIDGHVGTFALVHRGVLDQGAQDLSITVVPGSGTGELTGLTGVFALTIEGGRHRYDLTYSLPRP